MIEFTLTSAINGTSILGFPLINIFILPITSPAFIGAETGFSYSIVASMVLLCSKDIIVTISSLTIRLILGFDPNQTSVVLIICPFFNIFSSLVSLNAQFINFSASNKRSLDEFVPFMTTVILLSFLITEEAIPQPLFLVNPVFNPSAP